MTEAQTQALGIFADAVLKLALDVQQQALATEDVDQKVKLAGAVHQLGRSLRQTIALQAKLAREARRDADHAATQDDVRRARAIPQKQQAVRRAVERLVWTEYERDDDEAEQMLADLDEFLDDEAFEPGFLETPVEVLVARIAQTFELTLPPPPPGVPPAAANGHDSS